MGSDLLFVLFSPLPQLPSAPPTVQSPAAPPTSDLEVEQTTTSSQQPCNSKNESPVYGPPSDRLTSR